MIKVLTLPINDRAFVGIKEHFPTSGAWISEALQGGGKVLVNCFQGASRSATIVLAYLVEHEGLTLAEAVVKVFIIIDTAVVFPVNLPSGP